MLSDDLHSGSVHWNLFEGRTEISTLNVGCLGILVPSIVHSDYKLCTFHIQQRPVYGIKGPTESLQVHTHTVTHNTITSNQVTLSTHTHTQCVVSGRSFFQVIQGCRARFEPRTSHNSCSASSLNCHCVSHPCTPNFLVLVCRPGSYLHLYVVCT